MIFSGQSSVVILFVFATLTFVVRESSVSATPQTSNSSIELMVAKGNQPQIQVDSEDKIYCVFGLEDSIYLIRLAGNAGFDKPIRIATVKKLALGRRRGPRVCATNDLVVVSAISHETGQLVSWRSTDQGRTWSEASKINDADGSAKEGLHSMAMASDRTLCCVWLDFRNGKTELYSSISRDKGETWQSNVKVYTSPEKNICECCHPSVTFDPKGGLHVMWRNLIDGNRDMYYCNSKDGMKFTAAIRLGKLNWLLNQCPMDGGQIVATSAHQFYSVWRRDSLLLLSTGSGHEEVIGQGEQPVVTMTEEGPVVVSVTKRGGDLQLLWPGESEPIVIAKKASDPNVVAQGDWLIVAFESMDEENQPLSRILKIRLRDLE